MRYKRNHHTPNIYFRTLAVALILCLCTLLIPNGSATAAKKISINKKKVSLKAGDKVKLKVKGSKKLIKWSSSNQAVAVVNKKGLVTAKTAGTAKITAKAGGRKCSCKVIVSGYTFRSEYLMQQHYEKHGREMGYADAAAYTAGANRVIKSKDALFKREAEDNDGVYFLESTGEIVFVSTDGYIRTYFIADLNYFNRQ